jgi:hypothetical protein
MKSMKPAVRFVFGILAVFFAAGCSNPISSPEDAPADALGTDPGIDPNSPFTVTFTIGQDGNTRSVAGVDTNRIIVIGPTGLRNYVQLIVMDQTSKKVVGYSEDRKINADDSDFELDIDGLLRGNTYSFLLLMGHWHHDGSYNYDDGTPPILLAAGLTKDKQLNATGDTTVSITMYPLIVDTKFQSTDDGTTIEPAVVDGKPAPAYLTPGKNWKAIWTVQRSVAGSNGFEMALVPAQKVVNSGAGDNLLVKAQRSILSGTFGTLTNTGNSLSYTIPAANIQKGSSGDVNVNLEYVPFNLSAASAWNVQSSPYFTTTWPPVWIIRNGMNDVSQDGNTDFNNFRLGYFTNNGNGAVRFAVELKPTMPATDPNLKVQNGTFAAGLNTQWPTIQFDTSEYSGTADVWYAVVGPNGTPQVGDYTWVERVTTGLGHTERITVLSAMLTTGYDLYVIIAKGGKVSNPAIISARRENGTLVPWTGGTQSAVTNTNLAGTISAPVIDAAPVTTFSNTSSQYTGGTVTWYAGSSTQPYNGTFAPGTPYRATVTLTAKPGYTFTGVGSFSCGSLTVTTSNNTGNTIMISITYPAISWALIDLSPVISDVQNAASPFPKSTTLTPAFQTDDWYCEAINWTSSDPAWSENETFRNISSTEYTVTVTLRVKGSSSLTFTGYTGSHFSCHLADIEIESIYSDEITLRIMFPIPSP